MKKTICLIFAFVSISICFSQTASEYYNRGNSKSRNKDYKGAILDFTMSIELDPSSDAYNNRGTSKANINDYQGAIADFTKAIELNPSSDAFSNRAGAKGALKDYSGAISDFSKAIEIDPNDGSSFYGRGLSKIGIGQREDGCSDLSKAENFGYFLAQEARRKYCK
jgi:tetratricopeptide (TPR) repeat protein